MASPEAGEVTAKSFRPAIDTAMDALDKLNSGVDALIAGGIKTNVQLKQEFCQVAQQTLTNVTAQIAVDNKATAERDAVRKEELNRTADRVASVCSPKP